MLGLQREAWQGGSAMLDLAARWFRARAGLRRDWSQNEHTHWDPVNRTWQHHTHHRDRVPQDRFRVVR